MCGQNCKWQRLMIELRGERWPALHKAFVQSIQSKTPEMLPTIILSNRKQAYFENRGKCFVFQQHCIVNQKWQCHTLCFRFVFRDMTILCLVSQYVILSSFDILKLQYWGLEKITLFAFEENPACKSSEANWKQLQWIFQGHPNEITLDTICPFKCFWGLQFANIFCNHCHFITDQANFFLALDNKALQWCSSGRLWMRKRNRQLVKTLAQPLHYLSNQQHLDSSPCTLYMGLVKM